MADPRLHGPEYCQLACSMCLDYRHHWCDDGCDPTDPYDPDDVHLSQVLAYDREHGSEHALAFFACAHCPAWAEAEYVWDLEEAEEDDEDD